MNAVKGERVRASSLAVGSIRQEQRAGVVECLARNFPERSAAYWNDAFDRFSQWAHDQEFPSFGTAMEVDGKIVGVIMQIFSRHERDGQPHLRCNVSCWCVDKEWRAYAISLHNAAVSAKDVTYLNVTAATHTVPFIQAFGFKPVTKGQMFMLPALALSRRGARVVPFVEGDHSASLLSAYEQRVLADHKAMGCTAVVALRGGRASPFVFRPHKIFGARLPSAHLIFSRNLDDFHECSAALGRFLLFRFGPVVVVNVDAPLSGALGRFSPNKQPRFARGPMLPGPGDLAYTELTFLEQ